MLRIPAWVEGTPDIAVNGERVDASAVITEDGYAKIADLGNGSVIGLYLPSAVRAEALPDMPYQAAFADGPIVLAGLTGDVDTISGDFDNPDDFLDPVTEHAYDTFVWLQNNYRTKKQQKSIKLIPLYDVKDEKYTLYFENK